MPSVNLVALSSLLAHDEDAGRLNTRHLQLLAHLCASGEPMTVGTVAAGIGLSHSQTSRIVTKLGTHGLIEKTMNDGDQRLCLVAPTTAGRALDARVRAHVDTCRTINRGHMT
jgi:DNA-binding MarR family transcriptional regulator